MLSTDGGPSPVLEAHPGSPVDIADRRCPSLTSYTPAISYRSQMGFVDGEISPISPLSPSTNRMEPSIRRGGVAVKGNIPMMNDEVTDDDMDYEQTPTQFRSVQTFFIPDKVPDDEEVRIASTPTPTQDGPENVAMNTSWFDFDFGFDHAPEIPGDSPGNESKSSLTSTTTAVSGSNHRRFSHGALTVDTSVASSATSMASSDTSTYSAVSNTTDIYGWEEELDRRMSVENRLAWEPVLARQATSGGRMMMPPRSQTDIYNHPYKRVDMKRKGLLHRVFTIRRGLDETYVPAPPTAEYRTA
jgi:hypothetical protein